MCGRFVQDDELNTLLTTFALHGHRFPDYHPRWNIAPTQTVGLIREHRQDSGEPVRMLGPARWSLVPPWEKTLQLKYSTFNARAEKISHTKAFSGALAHHRALIPAGGYFEWVTRGDKKVPHYVTAPGSSGLAFASVYSWWQDASDRPPMCTATILTADAPEHLSWVHNRTPVFVPDTHWDTWLDPRIEGTQDMVDDLISYQPFETARLSAFPVGPVTGDGPHLVTPLAH